MNLALRNFALALLDDEHGISNEAWSSLSDMLYDDEQNDVINAASYENGRWSLTPQKANELRQRQE